MAEPNAALRLDQILSVEGGVDDGFPPPLIAENQNAWAVNATHRGGWMQARPGIVKRSTLPDIPEGLFQGAGTYTADNGKAFLAASVSGRIYLIDILGAYAVTDITIPGDANMASLPHAWFQQAENWLVVQNGLNAPFLYNGTVSRRAGEGEVPVGGPMAYGRGRLSVARKSLLYVGDLVWSDPDAGRDSVIGFTENDFLNEGGAFSVDNGPITGMRHVAVLDEGVSSADLIAYTLKNAHALNLPLDRTIWKNLNYPALRYIMMDYGAVNHESIITLNGDHMYRSVDGIRSLAIARRDFSEWGNSPISRQIPRALEFDTEERLWAASGANFDNRVLMTAQPQRDYLHGMWHRALVVLDFNLITGMGKKVAPAWDGVWTGLRILRILTLEVGATVRCFIFALSDTDRIELWELTKSRAFDFDGSNDVPIAWTVETRGFSFQNPREFKRLMSADQWYDGMLGDVSMRALFRSDGSECWQNWASWSDCAKYTNCGEVLNCLGNPYETYQPVRNYQAQVRSRISLPQPPDVPDPQSRGLTRDGYLFQIRYEMVGRIRLKLLNIVAAKRDLPPFGWMDRITCDSPSTGTCATDPCQGIECCPRDDYGYAVGGTGSTDYPGYPGEDGGGGGGEDGDDPLILFDGPTVTSLPQLPNPCDPPAETHNVASSYVWGLQAGDNPNAVLSGAQLACYAALFDAEYARTVQDFVAAGFVVQAHTPRTWVYSPAFGPFLSALSKDSTCDPFNPADDRTVLFNGFFYVSRSICIVPIS